MANNRQQEFPRPDDERAKCTDFLRNFQIANERRYMEQLQEISDRQRKVLEISMDDVLDYRNDDEFKNNIQNNTVRYLRYFEDSADTLLPAERAQNRERDVFDILQNQSEENRNRVNAGQPLPQNDMPKALMRRFEVVIVPNTSDRARKIREIKATDIGKLIKLKGMVTRASDVKPHVTVCTYTCNTCGAEIFQEVIGQQFTPITVCPAQRCADNKTSGQVLMQTRGSKFVKYQELRLQELPDQVPVGHIPRSITVHCRGEQTRCCGPGDIITVSGIFLSIRLSGYRQMKAGLSTNVYVESLVIQKQKVGYNDVSNDKAAEAAVREIARESDVYNRLAQSIAPEIFGHVDVKRALLLMLIGGVHRLLPDGMKIRGDVNICLMGDPGVAKSQLLKYIATVSPRGVYTTGKGSSGVGLTAAVVRDKMSGEMTLEGGALVLADMGICCIDEFDKMDENDRTAIHEVMEQQTISIAKAGITTTLNARAAVLAAANPLYGRYDRKKSISQNVDLPNSLLSRFDLLFLILDKAEIETDAALSRHVLHVHKYLKNPDKTFVPILPAVMKQFIAVARNIVPTVPQELTSYIVEAYVTLRGQDSDVPGVRAGRNNDQNVMTPRQLLSILRLSQGLARLRLASTISHEDVDESIRLTHSSKASLIDDTPSGAAGHEDTVSAIYCIIRDFANSQHIKGEVNYMQVEAMVVNQGYPVDAMRTTIEEYERLGVLYMSNDGTHIIFND